MCYLDDAGEKSRVQKVCKNLGRHARELYFLPDLATYLFLAKALGHFSPYGTYWAALSLIRDRVNPDFVEKLVSHVERWSRVHAPLLPRFLHLRAEIMSYQSPNKVRELCDFYSW